MYCANCGAPYNDGALFCEQCGAQLTAPKAEVNQESQNMAAESNETPAMEQSPAPAPSYNGQEQYYSGANQYQTPPPPPYNNAYGAPVARNVYGIQPRRIAVAILLSIVTCGIYGIYWMIKLNDEINQLAGEDQATSGAMVFLFTLLTCGIYGLFWEYKMGERVDRIKGTNGNSGILYLVLALFGLGIIDYCLMQDTINKSV